MYSWRCAGPQPREGAGRTPGETPSYSQAFVENAACQDMGGALASLQDESCFQQKQGVHLDREKNQGK